ncbi:MAG: SGNH/GDSL hydrolase family protein [Dysgonomonas sp.]
MKKQQLLKIAFLCIALLIVFSFTNRKQNVLIIGDSISIGYTPFVKKDLEKKAQVFHNPGNAQHTGVGLNKVKEWIGDTNWDVIQFNWGLWDLCYRSPESKVQGNRDKINGIITNSVDVYVANLDSIVTILKQETNAKLIFVTSTFIPEDEEGRFYEDAMVYNDGAIEVMKKHDVYVNDIYAKSAKIHRKHGMGSNNVHYTKEGYQELSNEIVIYLKKILRKR